MRIHNLIPLIVIGCLAFGCGETKSPPALIEEKMEVNAEVTSSPVKTNDCSSVGDCLDKMNFEKAREYCSAMGQSCDKLQLIEVESSFWIAQDEYERAKTIALEVFSLTKLSNMEKNDYFSEKLNDIIVQALLKENTIAAKRLCEEFPLHVDGDKTYKYHLDALKMISESAKKTSDSGTQKEYAPKIGELEKNIKAEKSAFETEKKNKLAELSKKIKSIELEKTKEIKGSKAKLNELKKEKEAATKKLHEIQEDFYLFSDRREQDIRTQNDLIRGIENKIDNIENLERDYNERIEAVKAEMEAIRLTKSLYD